MRPIRLKMVSAIALLSSALLTGCLGGTRTVYVKDGDPVRIRKTIKNAVIAAQDKDGKWVDGGMDLPEGWYALPDPGAKK